MMNWLKKLILLILVGFFKKRDYGSKISEIKGKNPSTSSITSTLNRVKNPTLVIYSKKQNMMQKFQTLEQII